MLFCGDAAEPLLVQRIGKARDAAAAEGPASGESGAKAVPSLGYVRRHSGQEVDRLLVEAAERAVAEHWARGKTVALPLPPPGLQWALLGNAVALWIPTALHVLIARVAIRTAERT